MATIDMALLEQKARRAYELARLRRASRALLVVLPLVALSAQTCSTPAASSVIGAGLATVAVGFLWRGRAWGRSVAPGMKAGLLAFSLPMAAHVLGYCCRFNIEIALCVGSGVVAGLLAGTLAIRGARETERTTLLVGSSAVAALTGALGCLAIGFGGALAALAGVAAVTVPLYLWTTMNGERAT